MKVKEENKEKFAEAMTNLVRAIKNETDNCAKLCGVVGEKELTVIDFVGRNQNVKMSDIADNIAAPMSTITSIMDKLVERKLISRDHSGEDRRVINVSLTPEGKTAFKTLHNKKKKTAETMLSKLNEKDQALVIKYLNQLASIIGLPG
jgi:DNA-binding MarR family transcriptional regulator